MRILLSFIIALFTSQFIYAQCTDGSEPECACESAELLCTIDKLDGFMFSMDEFFHPDDGPPGDLCPGASNTTNHNPTWFAFTAWCEELTLTVSVSNCSQNFNFCLPNPVIGAQIAIYEDCDSYTPVNGGCAVAGSDCNEDDKTLDMDGLIIGNTYYFLIDGCCGSACDVVVDIEGVCGNEEFGPEWDGGAQPSGEQFTCLGNEYTYTMPALTAANTYHWFYNGNEVETDEPFIDITWDEVGINQLCVDASNDPCLPIEEAPFLSCFTIVTLEPDAGNLTADPESLCPDEISTVTVSGYNTFATGLSQMLFVVDPNGEVVEITDQDMVDVTYDDCGVMTVYSLNYISADGAAEAPTVPDVGDSWSDPGCGGPFCCDLVSIDVSFEDTELPEFTDPPADLDTDCFDLVPPLADLDYTDNCADPGSVGGVENGSVTDCDGGSFERVWTVMDNCGNEATHTQTITIDPIPEPSFTNIPSNTTLACFGDITTPPMGMYTNSSSGGCLIIGEVTPDTDGTADICGGEITYTWTFTDICDRTIEESQTITIDPAPPAEFINLPNDVTVSCIEDVIAPSNLEYTNGESGDCEIAGDVPPTTDGTADVCGGTLFNNWTFTGPCDVEINYTQVVVVEPAPPAEFIDPPMDQSLVCFDDIEDPDQLSYTNGASGACLFQGTQTATSDGVMDICGGMITYTWMFTDPCDQTITHSQTLTAEPAPEAEFQNAPNDVTLNCIDELTTPPDLMYTNLALGGCIIEGMIVPETFGTADVCGGDIEYVWTFTDECMRTIEHSQNVTVDPAPEPAFIDPPMDISVVCFEDVVMPTDLMYTNGGTGACLFEGSVPPMLSGDIDICGGEITVMWTFTDACSVTIDHMQTITIEPAPVAEFIDPPMDLTLACIGDLLPPDPLMYMNTGTGACLIEGNAIPETIGDVDICGGMIQYRWEFIDDCDNTIEHIQTITVDPAPVAEFVDPPSDVTLACIGDFIAPSDLAYINTGTGVCLRQGTVPPVESGSADICGGELMYTWTFTDECDNTITHTQTITVEPAPTAEFVDPPGDQNLACIGDLIAPSDLAYINTGTGVCLRQGTVPPVESGSADICGGELMYTWTFTDECDNTIMHVQTITIDPAPIAEFIDPPGDENLACIGDLVTPSDLAYINTGTGVCLRQGTVPPVESGSADICGGELMYTWTFTDECDNTIMHVQTITIDPAPIAEFIDPPGDVNFACIGDLLAPEDLSYMNTGTGACLREGMVSAVTTGDADICGGEIQYTWMFTDECDNTIMHVQTIMIDEAPEPAFTDPPNDVDLVCSGTVPDAIDLAYSNGLSNACAIEGTVPPTVTDNSSICGGDLLYEWTFTDECDRTITHSQTITLEPSAEPMFLDFPSNETISCENIPTSTDELMYSNGDMGICLIEGSVPASITEDYTICGGTIENLWEFTDECDREISYTQLITIEPAPEAVFIDPPADMIISCEDIPTSEEDLDYSNGIAGTCDISGSVSPSVTINDDPCAGSITYDWEFTDDCDRTITHSQTLFLDPAAEPAFTSLPADITIDCSDIDPDSPSLDYTNNQSGICEISGTVNADRDEDYTICGGTITNTWEHTDDCDRTIIHVQVITINPVPESTFDDTPNNTTVSCEDANDPPEVLSHDNGESGMCNISGNVVATQTGSYDVCGGTLINTWIFVDDCGRPIMHEQTVTVEPADEPEFEDLPEDITLNCGDDFPGPFELFYDNGINGDCEIEGFVLPVIDDFGVEQEFTWTFENDCSGVEIEHSITIFSPPPIGIELDETEATICEGEEFFLFDLDVDEENGDNVIISFHFDLPIEPSTELPTDKVSPNQDTEYYIGITNDFGCTDFAVFTLFVIEEPDAGADGELTVCQDAFGIDLYEYLEDNPDEDGEWIDLDGSDIDVANPFNVSFEDVFPGTYELEYLVQISPDCPAASSILTVTVISNLGFDVSLIDCSLDQSTYSVEFTTLADEIDINEGTLDGSFAPSYVVFDIPISETLEVELEDAGGNCFEDYSVNPPDCDCPSIDPPIGPSPTDLCLGDPIPNLSVTVGMGQTANWYGSADGTDLLAGMTLDYLATITTEGVYEFYVEAEDTATGCTSSVRTLVSLIVYTLPVTSTGSISECDTDTDGFFSFNLTDVDTLINNTSGITVQFFTTIMDAIDNTNPIVSPFTNTTPNSQYIYAIATSANGCTTLDSLQLNVLPIPVYIVGSTNESCGGEDDGTITLSNPGSPDYQISVNNVDFGNQLFFDNLEPGQYIIEGTSSDNCIRLDTVIIEDGLVINLTAFNVECNDNGTNSDGSDDFYTIEISAQSLNVVGTSYDVLINGTVQSTNNYADVFMTQWPADGSIVNISLVDGATGCSIDLMTNPLITCSTNCDISVNQFDPVCNDNGTPSDSSDDFYTITVNASVLNGGAANTVDVLVDNVTVASEMYDTDITFTLPADGLVHQLILRDSDIINCLIPIPLVALTPCSDNCVIQILDENISCNSNGTEQEINDDTYTVSFTATGLNIASGFTIMETGETGTYDVLTSIGPILITDGDLNITLVDNDDPLCTLALSFTAPPPCSSPCSISLDLIDQSPCDNNNTGDDDTDDFFTATIVGTDIMGASNIYEIFINGESQGLINYGINEVLNNLPANGQDIVIDIVDTNNSLCTASLTLNQAPCSSCSQTLEAGDDFLITCAVPEVMLDPTISEPGTVFWTGPNNYTSAETTPTVSTPGTYVIEVSFSDGCISTDSLVITADNNIPIIDLGQDTAITCFNSMILIEPTISVDPTGLEFTWTNELGDVISTDQNYTFALPGTYTFQVLDPTTNCISNIDEIVIADLTEEPDISLSNEPGNTFHCDLDTIFIIGNGDDDIILSWTFGSTTITSDTIIATEPGTYSLTGLNPITGCEKTVSVELRENIHTLQVGDDEVITCVQSIITLNAVISDMANIIWMGPNGFVENDNPIMVDAPGMYIVDVIFPDGCTLTDTVNITADNNIPIVDLGLDTPITCLNNMILLEPDISTDPSGLEFTWKDENGDIISTDQNYTVTVPGTYTFEVFDPSSNCMSNVDDIVIADLTAEPIILTNAVPGETFHCDLDSILLVANSTDSLIYAWTFGTNTSSNDSLIATSPGMYMVTGVNPITGCESSATIELLENIHTIEAGDDQVITCSDPVVTLIGTTSDPADTQWFGPNGYNETGLMVMVDNPGTYYFEAAFPDGCTLTDSLSVTADNSIPIVDLGPDLTLNCVDTIFTVTPAVSGNLNDLIYIWTNQAGDTISDATELTFVSDTILFFEVFDPISNCRSNVDQIVIDDLRGDPVAIIYAEPTDVLDCVVEQIILTTDNQTNVAYSWFVNNSVLNLDSIQIQNPGTITLMAVDTITGCTSMTDINITDLQEYPLISLPETATLDCDNMMTTLNGNDSQTGSTIVSVWTNENGDTLAMNDLDLDVSIGGQYYLSLQDTANSCLNVDTITVIENILEPSLTIDDNVQLFCGEDLATLNIGIQNSGNNDIIEWTTANGTILSDPMNQVIDIQGSGTYTVEVENDENGCVSTANVEVAVDENVITDANVDVDPIDCGNIAAGALAFADIVGGTAPFDYILNGETFDNPNFNNLDAGNYNLEIIDANGCTAETNFIVDEVLGIDSDLISQIALTNGEQTELIVTVSIPEDQIASITWTNSTSLSCLDCLNPTYTAVTDETLEVVITDINGCETRSTIDITVTTDITIFIPNVFNPSNGEEENSNFTLFSDENIALINSFRIYDRWGNLVFFREGIVPNEPALGWNGRFNGELVIAGVFVYLIETVDINEGIDIHTGSITVIY